MTASNSTGNGTKGYSARVKRIPFGVKLAVLMLCMAAPVIPFTFIWPGFYGVAMYGIMVATLSWVSAGPKVSLMATAALGVFGAIGIVCRGQVWLLAVIVFLLGVGFGVAASRGVNSAVMQVMILTPYFMRQPPPLFSKGEPSVTPIYLISVVVIVFLGGCWAIFLLERMAGKRTLRVKEVPDPKGAFLYGVLLGLVSASVVVVGQTYFPNTRWVWITMTLYVLTNPLQPLNWHRMWQRVGGTVGGLAVVTILALAGVPDPVMLLLGLITLWACLYLYVTEKPYWEYVVLLSMTVVLINSYGKNTHLLDLQRMGFTLVGAALAITIACTVNLIRYHRISGTGMPELAGQGSSAD